MQVDADAIILEEIRAGNMRRCAVLIDRHRARAMTLAVRVIGDMQDAEEVVQDAFLRAFRGLSQFRGDSSFDTWFYRIVYNLSLTRARRRRHRPDPIDLQDEEALDSVVVDAVELSAHDLMERDETRELLASEMGQLPAHFQAALTLFYVQEMSYEEMAAVMGLPVGTLKTHLHRGRNLLRKRMVKRLKDEVKVA